MSSGPATGTGKGRDDEVPVYGRVEVSLRIIALAALARPLLQGQGEGRKKEAEERWLLSHAEHVRTYLNERIGGKKGFFNADAACGSSQAEVPDIVSGVTFRGTMPSSGGTSAEFDGALHSDRMDERLLCHAFQLLRLNPTSEDRKLFTLAGQLDLESVELLAVTLVLGVENDPWVGRAVAWLQTPLGGSRPTFGLLDTALAPFLPPGRRSAAALIAAGNAVRTGLLQRVSETAPLPEQSLKIPHELALFLMGERVSWPGEVSLPPILLPESYLKQATWHAGALLDKPDRTLIIRTGSRIEGCALATYVARTQRKKPLFFDADTTLVGGLAAFCGGGALVPVFLVRCAPGEQRTLPVIPGYNGPMIAVVEGDGGVTAAKGSAFDWMVEVPSVEERLCLWESYAGEGEMALEMAEVHLHGPARIAELAALSTHIAAVRGEKKPSREDITAAACGGDGALLGSLARLVTDVIPDEALVLSPSLRGELDHLLARCRVREGLSRNLGVTVSCRYRVGVRTLFVGPSGTGKTLAASWIATRLCMPLYAVDLAGVTSKYIGETEKNLSQLLSRAENADVILLFDEADSLFGKRTDVKDANDRFANSQTNYLLQRIETYRGIVILTSNSRTRFDTAFTRRIDMIVEFPLPSPEERRELWQAHLGTGHDVSFMEMNHLSTADICGGHIRNAVLHASVLAQQAEKRISFKELAVGLSIEYRKLGKMMPEELKRKTLQV